MSTTFNFSRLAVQNVLLWANRLLRDGGFTQEDVDAVTILDSLGEDHEVEHWITSVTNLLRMITHLLSDEFIIDDPMGVEEV